MLVQCKCGEVFDVEIPRLVYTTPQHETIPTPMAGRKCPNPECNKTIYIETNITVSTSDSQYIQDTEIDWYKSEIGDILYFQGSPYEVALKEVRTYKKSTVADGAPLILYVCSLSGYDNVVIEVNKDNSLSLMEANTKNDESPWYETWSEEKLRAIIKKRAELQC